MPVHLTTLLAQATQSAQQGWLAENATLVVGVVGIIVSGVVGPAVVAYFTAKRERAKDTRALIVARRDDLRTIVDESAKVLSGAIGALRPLLLAASAGEPLPDAPKDFLGGLVPLGQRLRLRLPANHPVVDAFDHARRRLEQVSQSVGSQAEFDTATQEFERARSAFLEEARKVLQAPVDEKKEL